jgi:hypothetical protein
MQRARGLAEMGVVLNAPYLGAWADRIGRFILNFGGIELLSYQHLLLLESSHEAFVENLDRLLGNRIDRLIMLLSSTPLLSPEEIPGAIELWKDAREFSKWRNRIAHNPVLPTWKPGSNADKDPPDLLGIPDFRQFKEGTTSDSIPIELMDRMIDESASLAGKLHDLSRRLRTNA